MGGNFKAQESRYFVLCGGRGIFGLGKNFVMVVEDFEMVATVVELDCGTECEGILLGVFQRVFGVGKCLQYWCASFSNGNLGTLLSVLGVCFWIVLIG